MDKVPFNLKLSTEIKENEFFDEDAISKSTIQALNNSFDKQQLDEQLERPFTPAESQEEQTQPPPKIEKEQCPYCLRSFFKGRLAPHLRSCSADKPLKPKKKLIQVPQSVSQPTTQCPHCQKKLTTRKSQNHVTDCPCKPKALDKYQKYVAASINEEVDDEETQNYISQKELSNSQPSFLPKIQQKQPNLLSRSVPIQKCPSCSKVFEQKAAQKHIPICLKMRMNSGGEKRVFQYKQQQQQLQRTLFCTNCGSKFANQDKYCGVCGKKRI